MFFVYVKIFFNVLVIVIVLNLLSEFNLIVN